MPWRRWLRSMAAAPFRVLPARLRREVIRSALVAEASIDPGHALRGLLQLDADLSGLIDETGMRYEGGVHPKHRLTRYHDFFVERIRPGERVLDVGCGDGSVAYSVASRAAAHVTAIDVEAGHVARARARFAHPGLSFVVGDATRETPGGRFDVVLASNLIEHIADRLRFYRAVQERARASRWLVRVPMIDREWRVPLRQELGVPHFSDGTHFTEYTRASFEAEAREAGFVVTHLQINWGEIWAELVPGA